MVAAVGMLGVQGAPGALQVEAATQLGVLRTVFVVVTVVCTFFMVMEITLGT